MPKTFTMTDVPFDQIDDVTFFSGLKGGKVTATVQTNGLYTLTIVYPGMSAAPPAVTPFVERAAPVERAASVEPVWMSLARGEIGVREAPGTANNPRVVEYLAASTHGAGPDSVAWCGGFVAWCLMTAGILAKGKGSAVAKKWLDWGVEIATPRIGCVVVLKPLADGATGHVGFYAGHSGGQILLLAGNQSDAVNITPYPTSYVVKGGFRWPG